MEHTAHNDKFIQNGATVQLSKQGINRAIRDKEIVLRKNL